MKRIVAVTMLWAGVLSFQQADAQRVKVNTNQTQQPAWGLKGYNYVSYYFLPEMNMYYYVPDKKFIYQENGNWRFSDNLPAAYRNQDLNRARKVVINDPKPYTNHHVYAAKYGPAVNNDVVSIRDVRSSAWNANRSAVRHGESMRADQRRRESWNKEDRNKKPKKQPGRGNAYGHYK